MTNVLPLLLDWDLTSFLTNSTNQLQTWGGLVISLIGVIMIIAGVYQLAKGLMSQGRGQTNWAVVVLLIIVGGAFIAGGWKLVSDIASGGEKTIRDLGNIIMLLR